MQICKLLKEHNKIIVTGPYRSGTTIAGMILADELGYEYIDESLYDGNDVVKFSWFLFNYTKSVIQTTSFIRDLHILKDIPIVLVRRPIKDILESFENSKRFKSHNVGLFTSIDDDAQKTILEHYGIYNNLACVPEVIYGHFEKHNKNYHELNYNDLKYHRLFVPKEFRRTFTHLKQTEVSI